MAQAPGSLSLGVPFPSTSKLHSSVTPTAGKRSPDDPQNSCGLFSASLKDSSVVGDSNAGTAGAQNGEDCASALSEAKQLFIRFLEDYLEISFIGFQSTFGRSPSDLILFRAPVTKSTLAVECSVLLQPRHEALEVIRKKIETNQRQFAVNNKVEAIAP